MASAVSATRMIRRLSDEKASDLAKEAIELVEAGDSEKASRKLREAASFGHTNADVQAAFLRLHSNQTNSPLVELCRRYSQYHDDQAGDKAIQLLLNKETTVSGDAAVECIKLVLESKPSLLSHAQDTIIAALAHCSQAVRLYMSMELQASSTEFFDNLYERGDKAANCLRAVVLESALWPDNSVRLRVQEDLFQLFLAKLMESGHDLDGRALKGIALLLMADAERLKHFIDEEGFEALLTSLDIQLPADVRGQATLVISKYLEVAGEPGRMYFTNFVTNHVRKQKADDLILAFSAAAAVFAVSTAIVGPLFMTEGFLPGLMPFMDRKINSTFVQDSFLSLLNAACIDSACRKSISTHCSSWLVNKVSNGSQHQNAVAASILAKLRTAGDAPSNGQGGYQDFVDVSDLVEVFQAKLRTDSKENVSNSIEGLAYTSLKPEVKEKLAQNTADLRLLLSILEAKSEIPEVVVGALSTISNITQYRPTLTEEQQKIAQLKAYANASKPAPPNPLEDEEHVRLRCEAVIEAGIVPTLVKINKSRSPSTSQVVDKILLSLTKDKKYRGRIAQEGAVKLLISHLTNPLHPASSTPAPSVAPATSDAAHALARLLISLNPVHVFPKSGSPNIADAVPPLIALLKPPNSENEYVPSLAPDAPRDLLPVFESLLALTNLAQTADLSTSNLIIRAWDVVEDLCLSNNPLLRRASVELICNLCNTEKGAMKFTDKSSNARRRIHLMLAMADVDDTLTRRAASGALAMLLGTNLSAPVAKELVTYPRGAEIILDLISNEDAQDHDLGLFHRGLVIIGSLLESPDEDIAKPAQQRFNALQAFHRVKLVLTRTMNAKDVENDASTQAVLECGMEVLRNLDPKGLGMPVVG